MIIYMEKHVYGVLYIFYECGALLSLEPHGCGLKERALLEVKERVASEE